MQLQAYRYLSEILEAGSISRAAVSLGISQPSLSQFVQRLEKEIGAELFDRSARPLALTESGRIFFDAENASQKSARTAAAPCSTSMAAGAGGS